MLYTHLWCNFHLKYLAGFWVILPKHKQCGIVSWLLVFASKCFEFFPKVIMFVCQCLSGNRRLAIILSVTSAVLALLITTAAVLFFVRRRVLKRRRGNLQLIVLQIYEIKSLSMHCSNIVLNCFREKATRCSAGHREQIQTQLFVWSSWKSHQVLS